MYDMIGKQFGKLTVLKECGTNKWGEKMYECVCSCGNKHKSIVSGSNLRKGKIKSCGCMKIECGKSKAVDISGRRSGHLVALYPTSKRSGSFVVWHCRCDYCGNECDIPYNNFVGGQQSCGKCSYAADRARERMTVWKSDIELRLSSKFSKMIRRCYVKNDPDYKDFGAKGVYICKEWTDDRREFVKWGIATGYKPGMSIDRIDPTGPYAPWNCRWANDFIQANNHRKHARVTSFGIRATIAQWAILIARPPNLLYQLNREGSNGSDVKVYIDHVWGNMTKDEHNTNIGRLNRKFGMEVVPYERH